MMGDQVLAFFFLSSLFFFFFIFHSQVSTNCCSVLLMLLGMFIAPSTLNSKSLSKRGVGIVMLVLQVPKLDISVNCA